MRRASTTTFAFVSVFVLALSPPLPAEESVRRVNDGNVVLDGVPEIPERIGEELNRYQNVRGASFQDWAVEGNGLYVTTRFADTEQIHYVATPGGARRQLTFFPEPVSGADRRPGGAELAFVMDEGGSEFYQIFLLDPLAGDHRRLTDGASRNGAAEWSPNGARLAFQSTRRNGRSNDVWLMEVGNPDSARLVLEAPDGSWWGPAEWSPSGDHLLVQQYVSVTDSRLHLLDLESGESRRLLGDEEDPNVHLAETFAPDGRGIYLTTDRESEFIQLAYLDLASGDLEVLTTGIPWNVDDFALSADGRRGAFEVNEGGISRLYLFDPAARTHRAVEGIPVGLLGGLEFSPSGDRLAMTLNTARTPSDVFTLALGDAPLEHGELVRWTFSEVGGLDTEAFVEPELVHYPTFDRVDGEPRRIPAFVYRPPGA
ncbi:MAG: S9 family peptidase, partial [Thermoanaerobaculia bacterium]|nr:S9 family peptidase [Thermoanaerobaculia bacterium]